jgi:hypothetical protein
VALSSQLAAAVARLLLLQQPVGEANLLSSYRGVPEPKTVDAAVDQGHQGGGAQRDEHRVERQRRLPPRHV